METFSPQEIKMVLLPLIKKLRSKKQRPLIIGLQGGQGTGKTTLGKFLKNHLTKQGFKVQQFSIDDFYLSLKKRQSLQKKYPTNPFYQIRGMPGTHRLLYLQKTLQKLQKGKACYIPIFDKSLHAGQGDAEKRFFVKGRQDFIIFDGWCLGLLPVPLTEVLDTCKKYAVCPPVKPQDYQPVLDNIKPYQKIWQLVDYLVMLKPDSSQSHQQWRWQQEQELIKKTGSGKTQEQVISFVKFYLPLTYVCYDQLKPDYLIKIREDHSLYI